VRSLRWPCRWYAFPVFVLKHCSSTVRVWL
jgi:hypothetical protein